ncbi:MAG: hypothetical protein ACKVJG_07480 [Candidatus Latescibacterota bacterium]
MGIKIRVNAFIDTGLYFIVERIQLDRLLPIVHDYGIADPAICYAHGSWMIVWNNNQLLLFDVFI